MPADARAPDPARWERVQALFHDAADRPAPERRAFLEAACPDDPSLVPEVLALLATETTPAAALLEWPLAEVAGDVLGEREVPALRDVGPYRILRVLGEGGMGVVYLAERPDLRTHVALKLLRDGWLSPARRERFAAEQRTLAQLDHPGIARLLDAGTLPDGTPWFVMEYVDGVPLTAYAAEQALDVAARLRLFRAVCEAVQDAHRHAVIHRDLKPSNILVRQDGSPKLLDFGIAKQLEQLTPVDQTRSGMRLMTPAYAAPEQVRGQRVGVFTDVYSLGIVLYELLAGKLPFDLAHLTPSEADAVIVQRDPVRPSAVARTSARTAEERRRVEILGRTAWADIDVICLTAMQKDPAHRYATADALIRDVDHYLAGQPLDARPESARYRLGKFVRRHRRAVATATAAMVALTALVGFYTVRLRAARNAAVAEAARTQRVQAFMLNLFQGGDDAVGPADSLRVVTLLDKGAEDVRRLDQEPDLQAELRQTLGGLYQKLGNFPRADSLLQAALDARRTRLGLTHADVGESEIALGLLRLEQAELPEAERLVRAGLATTRTARGEAHPAVTRGLAALGQVLQTRGNYGDAIAVQADVVQRLSRTAGDSPELANALSGLAGTEFYAGHLARSDSLNARVLEMTRRLYGARHPLVAEDLVNLGATRFERGDYAAAEAYYREALAISRAWYGEDHPVTASHLTMLGRSLVYQNRLADGVVPLRQALAVRERVYGPMHPMVASTLNDLAIVANKEGRLDEAKADYGRMVQIYRTAYSDRHYLIGTALSNLATVYVDEKQYVLAERTYREALRRFSDAQGPDHLNTGIAHIKLGRALLRQAKFAEAEPETLAGYEIVRRQASPAISFLRAARNDLVKIYDGLHRPEQAARFRAELADTMAAPKP